MEKEPATPTLQEAFSGLSLWFQSQLRKLSTTAWPLYVVGGVAFVALACWFLVGSTSRRQASAIRHVIAEDKSLSQQYIGVLTAESTPSQIAEAIRAYCVRANQVDLAECPPKFQVSYKDHLRAWGEAASAIDELPDGIFSGLWQGFLNSITRGEVDGGMSRYENSLSQASQRIAATWKDVQYVAAEHGVPPTE